MRAAAYGDERKGDMQRPVDDSMTTSSSQADLLEHSVFKTELASTKTIGGGARKPRAARAWGMVVWVKRACKNHFLFVIFRSISIKPYAPNGVARRKTAFLAHADTIRRKKDDLQQY